MAFEFAYTMLGRSDANSPHERRAHSGALIHRIERGSPRTWVSCSRG